LKTENENNFFMNKGILIVGALAFFALTHKKKGASTVIVDDPIGEGFGPGKDLHSITIDEPVMPHEIEEPVLYAIDPVEPPIKSGAYYTPPPVVNDTYTPPVAADTIPGYVDEPPIVSFDTAPVHDDAPEYQYEQTPMPVKNQVPVFRGGSLGFTI
jgi:hypothetical protein